MNTSGVGNEQKILSELITLDHKFVECANNLNRVNPAVGHLIDKPNGHIARAVYAYNSVSIPRATCIRNASRVCSPGK